MERETKGLPPVSGASETDGVIPIVSPSSASSVQGWRGTMRPTADEIGEKDYRALAEFRRLIRQFLATSEAIARTHGLTPQQHQLMLAIAGRPAETEPNIGYLADRLKIKHHSAVGLVDRLAEQGLVARQPSQTDRRRVLVGLTEAGSWLLKELSAIHRAELRVLEPHLVQALSTVVEEK